MSASLARPSAGGAVTDTFRTGVPSAERTTPSMRLARARGVRRICRRTPSAAAAKGASVDEGRGKDVEDQLPQEHQDQNQDHRRDIDAAEIRQKTPDRTQ